MRRFRRRRKSVPGFWASLWAQRRGVLGTEKPWVSLGVGIVVTILSIKLSPATVGSTIMGLASAELSVGSAMLGVVLAGMAVVVVFLSDRYLRLFAELPDPVARFERILFAFWFTAGLAVASMLCDLFIFVVGPLASTTGLRAMLGVSTWLITWTLFEVMGLMGLLSGHGANRARQVLKEVAPRKEVSPREEVATHGEAPGAEVASERGPSGNGGQ